MKNSPIARKFLSIRMGRMHHHRHHGKFHGLLRHHSRKEDMHFMTGYAHHKHHEKDHHHHEQLIMGHDHHMKRKIGHHHDMIRKMGHHSGMKHKMGHRHVMKHGMRHRGMKHKHDKMHKEHNHGMRDQCESDDDHLESYKRGHDLQIKCKRFHGMKHRMGCDRKNKMRHGHGMKHRLGQGLDGHHRMRFERFYDSDQEDCSAEENCEETGKALLSKSKTVAHVTKENNKFQISLDTSYYQPEKVTVEIMDGKINVSALHESMEDELYEFHEMYRSFNIPADVNPINITTHINADGKLIVEAPISTAEENNSNEGDVPVTQAS